MMRRNHIEVVFGKKGSGKTYYAKGRVDDYAGPAIIWDHAHDFAGRFVERPVDGALVFSSVREAMDAASAGKLGDRPRVVLQAHRGSLRDHPEFDAACAWALRAGNLLLVVDEVDQYCSSGFTPRSLSDVLSLGRHTCVDQLYLTRRPAEIAREITANADALRAFRTTEPRDLDYLAGYCGSAFVEGLKRLPRFGSATWTGEDEPRPEPATRTP